MKKLVSIIIPTYKRSKKLKEAIESVLNQTYKNIEVIVVDDNHPNTEYRINNEKLMKEYKDNRNVIYIKHSENKNGAAARNTGINKAKGEYIGFLDDDDEFLREKIERQVNFLENNYQYNCVGCQIYRGDKIEKQVIKEKTLLLDVISLKVAPITSTLLFRADTIREMNGFNEKYRRHQDVEIMVRYLQKNKLGYIKAPLIKMGINNGENQLEGKQLKEMKEQFLNEFEPVIDILEKEKKGNKKKILCSHYTTMVVNFLKNKNKELLKETLKEALHKYPITFIFYFIKSVLYRIWIHLRWRRK